MAEKPTLTVGKDEAFSTAADFLKRFPHTKAVAMRRNLEWVRESEQKKFFGIVDLENQFTNYPLTGLKGKQKSPASELMDRINGSKRKPLTESSVVPVKSEIEGLRRINQVFDPRTGAILFPASWNIHESPVGEFFTQDTKRHLGLLDRQDGVIELRGSNYYQSLDSHILPQDRLEIMRHDIQDALAKIKDFSHRRSELNNPRDFLLYLGVMDYLKIHTQTLFHGLTFPERQLEIPNRTEAEQARYNQAKLEAQKLMDTTTRMFYQTMQGLPYDRDVTPEQLETKLQEIMPYISQNILDQIGPVPDRMDVVAQGEYNRQTKLRFPYPEVNHPLVIALGAMEAARAHTDTNVVIGVPTGGTEPALVTRLMAESFTGRRPNLMLIPVSFHSRLKAIAEENLTGFIDTNYPGYFEGKKVLLIDDNSSTGKTLTTLEGALMTLGAEKIEVHVNDVDLRRVIKADSTSSETFFNINRSPTSMGLMPITESGKDATAIAVSDKAGRSRNQQRFFQFQDLRSKRSTKQ